MDKQARLQGIVQDVGIDRPFPRAVVKPVHKSLTSRAVRALKNDDAVRHMNIRIRLAAEITTNNYLILHL